jgi:hypothetical protein
MIFSNMVCLTVATAWPREKSFAPSDSSSSISGEGEILVDVTWTFGVVYLKGRGPKKRAKEEPKKRAKGGLPCEWQPPKRP